ncbi:hypothetical protein KY330_04180 [Candidatus Woesearchaeota archaeon]|nr:hypothetical protein [Candidatus Woesearchaeota archaeon]
MADIRKYIIIFVVAILFSILVFSVIEAAYPEPEWEDFCDDKEYARAVPIVKETSECEVVDVPEQDKQDCKDRNGYIDYEYDSRGCATDYYCNTCTYAYEQANEVYRRYLFYISAFLALIAIFVGMYLPAHKNVLNEWIGTGFMLGGAFALFFGTATSFSSLDRLIRPIVIFLELALVIFISYKKIGNLRRDRRR